MAILNINVKAQTIDGETEPAQRTAESGTKYTKYRTLSIDGVAIPDGMSNEGAYFGMHIPDGRYSFDLATNEIVKLASAIKLVS